MPNRFIVSFVALLISGSVAHAHPQNLKEVPLDVIFLPSSHNYHRDPAYVYFVVVETTQGCSIQVERYNKERGWFVTDEKVLIGKNKQLNAEGIKEWEELRRYYTLTFIETSAEHERAKEKIGSGHFDQKIIKECYFVWEETRR